MPLFLSHSNEDAALTSSVRRRLSEAGYRDVFVDFDPEDGIPAGRDWERELYHALRQADAVVVLCSPGSMRSSWCFAEIAMARAIGKPIFPVRVRPCEVHPLLRDRQIVDLIDDPEDGYRRLLRGLRLAGLDPNESFDRDPNRPPYPGLVRFDEADAAVYFGREPEIGEVLGLLTRLARHGESTIGVVVGSSGSGKSSLMRAGVLPRLRKDPSRWLVLPPVDPGESPLESLVRSLVVALPPAARPADWEAFVRAQIDGAGGGLAAVCARLILASDNHEARAVLLVDQMENALSSASVAQAETFFRAIARDARDHSPIIVLTIRSESLGALQRRAELAEIGLEALPLGPMPPSRFSRVIERPAAVAGVALDDGLGARMSQEAGVEDALPLLAFTLRHLYEKARTAAKRTHLPPRLTARDYELLGGVAGAVEKVVDRSLGPAMPRDKRGELRERALRMAFLALVRLGDDGRFLPRTARWTDLPEPARPVLERLIDAYLLVSSTDQDGSRVIHVAHEALFRAWRTLGEWLKDHRDFLAWRRRFEADLLAWTERGRRSEDLLVGPRLKEALRWSDLDGATLTPEERHFIARSRRNAVVLRAVIGTVALAVAALVLVLLQRQAASDRAAATNAELAAAAARLAQRGAIVAAAGEAEPLTGGLILAEMAGEPEPRRGIRTAKRIAEQAYPLAELRHEGGAIQCARFSPDGERILSWSWDGTARLWSPDGRGKPIVLEAHRHAKRSGATSAESLLVARPTGREPVLDAGFIRGGKGVYTRSRGGTVLFWDLAHPESPTWTGEVGDGVLEARVPDAGWPLIVTDYDATSIRLLSMLSQTSLAPRNAGMLTPRLAEVLPGGKEILAVPHSGVVQRWSVDAIHTPKEITRVGEDVDEAWLSPSGRSLVVSDTNHRITALDLSETPPKPRSFQAKHWPTIAGFLSDEHVVLGFDDGGVVLWRLHRDGGAVFESRHGERRIKDLAVSASHRLIATASDDGTARLWRIASKGERLSIESPVTLRHLQSPGCVDISSDGKHVLTTDGGDEGIVRVWSTSPRHEPRVLLSGVGSQTRFSHDGRKVLAVAGERQRHHVRVWDLDTGAAPMRRLPQRILEAAFSADDRRVIACVEGGSLVEWSWGVDAEPKPLVSGGRGAPHCVPDESGTTFVAYDFFSDSNARILRADGATHDLAGTQKAEAFAVSRDGKKIFSSRARGPLQLFETAAPNRPVLLGTATTFVRLPAFSPKGDLVAGVERIEGPGAVKTAIRVWRTNGATPLVIDEIAAQVGALAFDESGRRIGIGTTDGEVRIYAVEGGARPIVLPAYPPGRDVISVAFSHDGNRVAASDQATVVVWSADGEGSLVEVRPQHPISKITSATFSKDDTLVLVDTQDGAQIDRVTWPALLEGLRGWTTACLRVEDRRQFLGEPRDVAEEKHAECEARFGR